MRSLFSSIAGPINHKQLGSTVACSSDEEPEGGPIRRAGGESVGILRHSVIEALLAIPKDANRASESASGNVRHWSQPD